MDRCFGCKRKTSIPIVCIWCKNVCCSKCTQIEIHDCPEKIKKIQHSISVIINNNKKITCNEMKLKERI